MEDNRIPNTQNSIDNKKQQQGQFDWPICDMRQSLELLI